MGCGGSKERTAHKTTVNIDKQLEIERQNHENEIRLLLLGAGESGKSTIAKQMKIIHQNGFTIEEKNAYIVIVQENVVICMSTIVNAMEELQIELDDPANKSSYCKVLEWSANNQQVNPGDDVPTIVKALWADKGIKKCFERNNEYQLKDNASYYFNEVDRLYDPAYVVSEQDLLISRVKTTGITESHFSYKGLSFRMFDVGGQRSERKKWIHCFEGVTAIIFCVALNGYDCVLREDHETNRMHEALTLFEAICNSKWFVKTPIILFLNKVDLFEQKITKSPLKVCFPEYEGENTFEEASEFIRNMFESMNRGTENAIYSHFTCATDTENINFVFDVVTDILIQRNFREVGLM
eukprot:CFRG0893T1